MLFQIKSYLKFLYHSKNEHGVHSPFIFDLVTKCFYDKNIYPEYAILKEYRNSLVQNNNFIEVTDFGAGSRVFKSNIRQISKIAKTAGISTKRAELLFRIIRYFQPDPNDSEQAKQNILEIGTSLGLATSSLSLGNPMSKIITLEGCNNTAFQCQLQFQKFNFNNVNLIATEFSSYFKTFNLQPIIYNLIYFDGNHSKKATLEYFELLLPTISNDSVWIFDDIHWSDEMEEAWEMIKKHAKVKVTIDIYRWGFVFFRNEQEKEHFVIRV